MYHSDNYNHQTVYNDSESPTPVLVWSTIGLACVFYPLTYLPGIILSCIARHKLKKYLSNHIHDNNTKASNIISMIGIIANSVILTALLFFALIGHQLVIS